LIGTARTFDRCAARIHVALVRRAPRFFALLPCVLLAAGCPISKPPPAPLRDLGTLPDSFILPGVDTDEDGVCDDSEFALDLDPMLPDTDLDGYPDWFELAAGYQGTIPSSPPREELLILAESADGEVTASIATRVNGMGETFSGSFDPQIIRDSFGATAGDFFVSARATGAEPPANVVRIDPDGRRFDGVRGRTLLFSEVRLAFGDDTPLLCVRAYPFRYFMKTDTGRIVGSARRLVLILPPGATAASGPWCTPPPPCW